MMTKNKSTQWLPVKALALLIVVAATSFAYANSDKSIVADTKPDANTEMFSPKDTTKVYKYDVIDVKPEFPGGKSALTNFLMQNIKYPEDAKKNGIQGKVYISFVINKQGQVTDVAVDRSVHTLLDAEALRVVSAFPNWTPGEANGKAVNVEFKIPINFKFGPKQ